MDAHEILHFVFDYVLNDKMKNKNSVELLRLCGEKSEIIIHKSEIKKWKTKTKAFGVKS